MSDINVGKVEWSSPEPSGRDEVRVRGEATSVRGKQRPFTMTLDIYDVIAIANAGRRLIKRERERLDRLEYQLDAVH